MMDSKLAKELKHELLPSKYEINIKSIKLNKQKEKKKRKNYKYKT